MGINTRRSVFVLAALGSALVCAAADSYDDGDKFPTDKGVLIFKIERERTQHSAVARRGSFQLELRAAGTGERVSLNSPTRIKGYILKPGRYYVYSLRDMEGGMDVSNISAPGDGFIVEAGTASWAGTVVLALGASGTQINVVQGDKERAELSDKFMKLLATGVVRRVLLGGPPLELPDPESEPDPKP